MKAAATLGTVLLLFFVAPGSAQVPREQKSFELRDEGPPGGRRIPLEKQPGDSVSFDEATLDIVATSNGKTYRFRPQNLSRPVVKCTLSESEGRVRYTYEVMNESGAEHPVSGFSIPVPEPRKTAASPPARWTVHSGVLGPELSIVFLHMVRDDEVSEMVTAGKAAGPFRLETERLPGLRVARIHGGSVEFPAPGESEGERQSKLSQWARQRVLELELEHRERSRKDLWIVAPTVRPDQDSLETLRAEITQALKLPEVAPAGQRLRAAITSERIGEIVKQIELAQAEALPGTLARAFANGVLLRLNNLQQRGVR